MFVFLLAHAGSGEFSVYPKLEPCPRICPKIIFYKKASRIKSEQNQFFHYIFSNDIEVLVKISHVIDQAELFPEE